MENGEEPIQGTTPAGCEQGFGGTNGEELQRAMAY